MKGFTQRRTPCLKPFVSVAHAPLALRHERVSSAGQLVCRRPDLIRCLQELM